VIFETARLKISTWEVWKGASLCLAPLQSVTAPFRQGRVVFFYAAIQIRFAGSWQHKKILPDLDFILAFWLSAFSIFPFTAFTKCALILNKS
jgi:hypothetical protein